MRRLSIEVGDKDVFQVVDDPEGEYVLFADHAADIAAAEKQREAVVGDFEQRLEAALTAGAAEKAQRAALEGELKIQTQRADNVTGQLEKWDGLLTDSRRQTAEVSYQLNDTRVLRDQYAAQLRSIRNLVDVALPPTDAPATLEDLVAKFWSDVEALKRRQ